jgi:regulator of replication initiation timing
MTDPKDQKIATLEQQLQKLTKQVNELNQRVSFLERENNRRKQDVNILAQRKG